MKLSDFDFELPADRIAQTPPERRGDSRLMVVGRGAEPIDETFAALGNYLTAGDLLVLNDTRVLPVRLYGEKETGGRVELLLVQPAANEADESVVWSCMMRSARKPAVGSRLGFGPGLKGRYLGRDGDRFLVGFDVGADRFSEALSEAGRMPLPPYIRRSPEGDARDSLDRERYQTVFAKNDGAIAAPTAGLHFRRDHLAALKSEGIDHCHVTLHVGAGTFLPVRVEELDRHRMHAEAFEIPEHAAAAIRGTRERGGRVIAVGTTVTRTLESQADEGRTVRAGRGESDLFIRPGYEFRVVDGILTNFHLPQSTLLMLVSAFSGMETIRNAYRHALETGYRFYSYGDAMLLR